MPGARQQRHVGVAEKGGQSLDGSARRPEVVLTRHQQHRHRQRGKPLGQRRVRVEAGVEPLRGRLGARAAVVKQDQRPVTAEAAQIPEVLDRLAWPAGDAQQRRAGASHSICQFRALPGAEPPHRTVHPGAEPGAGCQLTGW